MSGHDSDSDGHGPVGPHEAPHPPRKQGLGTALKVVLYFLIGVPVLVVVLALLVLGACFLREL